MLYNYSIYARCIAFHLLSRLGFAARGDYEREVKARIGNLMAPNEQNPFIGLVDIEKGVQNFARQFIEVFEEVKRALEPAAKTFVLILEGLSELQRQSKLIDKAGFVPHPTMPQKLIRQSSGDPTRLSELLVHYYEENWPEVRDAARAGRSASTAEPSECGSSAGSVRGAGTKTTFPQLKKRAAEAKLIYLLKQISRARI